jgi:hypothetical protein
MEKSVMTIVCNNLDNLLLEGDAYSMRIAAEHAAGCEACAEKLAAWNEISDTARGMHTTWQNDMLWPRIERALQREQRRTRTTFLQIAASLLIFAALAAIVWTAHVRMRANQFDRAIMRESAVDEVEQAERQHVAAINNLEKLAGSRLDDPATPLLVSYKEKLMLLDDAIKQCQGAIEQNRRNAHLRRQLLAIYSEKQRTLQDVLREESHGSNR